MDPSAPAAQDVQTQTPADQTVSSVSTTQDNQQKVSSATDGQAQITSSQPAPATQPKPASAPPKKQQISISGGGIEEGASMILAENPDADEDDEDELQAAPQEKKNLGIMGQGADAVQDVDRAFATQ